MPYLQKSNQRKSSFITVCNEYLVSSLTINWEVTFSEYQKMPFVGKQEEFVADFFCPAAMIFDIWGEKGAISGPRQAD